jgi:hypothetical protein
MLTEARQDFLVELRSCDGGLGILPSSQLTPKKHRFQGGLLYSRMIEVEARVLAPQGLAGRRMRIWLSQLEGWHFGRHEAPYIGDIHDREGELPGGGLEATLYVPRDAWLTSIECLTTIWRRLRLTGVDGDGRKMTLIDFSFSSLPFPPPG